MSEASVRALAAARAATAEATSAAVWDGAVEAWHAAIDLLPDDDGELPLALSSAAHAHLARAWSGGPATDLDVAVALWRRAAEIPDASHRSAILSNLGVALRELWERDGDPATLDECVEAGRRAVSQPDAGPGERLQLGKSLRERFAVTDSRSDLDEAIAVLSGGPANGDGHETLGNALYDRYSLAGEPVDQDIAITHLRRAVELSSDGDADHPAYASNLASALLDRFERRGERSDLDDAVLLLEAALNLSPEPTSLLLTNAGNALRLRAAFDGSLGDAERAVDLLERAVAAEGRGVRRAGLLSNLVSGLLERYELTGAIADLDRAVALQEDVVNATRPDDPARPARLSNLGIALRHRHLRRRAGRDDVDRAVRAFEHALADAPDDLPDAPAYHANLGNALHQRYDITNDPADLERAVTELEIALSRTADGSADRAAYLNNLGATLSARGSAADLARAVELTTQAVELTTGVSSAKATFLINLANAASERHVRLGDSQDLAIALEAYRAALATGLAASPAAALMAARNWTEWACGRREWPEVVEAFTSGDRAMWRLLEGQLLRADKESWLRDAHGLVADGAYALASENQPHQAVTALERGRAILGSQDEARLERVTAVASALAVRYRSAAANLRANEVRAQ